MSIIEKAKNLRNLIKEYAEKSEDKTLVIATSEYFDKWVPGEYSVGDIRTSDGKPYECILSHDSKANPDWTIDVRTLWKPYHARKAEYALPWEAPTGTHDMYLNGEYMIWTDGITYFCKMDTVYSPEEYAQAWNMAE